MIKILYDIFYTSPVSLLMILLIGPFTGMTENSAVACFISLFFTIWMVTMRYAKKKQRIIGIGIFVVFFLGFTGMLAITGQFSMLLEYSWLLCVVCFSVCSLIVGYFLEKWQLFRRVAGCLLVAGLLAAMVRQWEISRITVALTFFMILLFLVEEIQRNWKKSGYSDLQSHVALTSPMLLVLCISITFFPAPKEPYDWAFVEKMYAQVEYYVNRVASTFINTSEEYSTAGFSEGTTFSGTLKKSKQKVYRVSANKNYVNNVHMIGSISEDFDGEKWKPDTAKQEDSFREMDTIETVCAVKRYAGSKSYIYMRNVNLRYKSYYHNTNYMFAPAKTRVHKVFLNNPAYHEEKNRLLTNQKLKYGDTYTVSSFVLNYEQEQLQDILTHADKIEKSEWENVVNSESVSDLDAFSYDAYQKYQKSIYKECCDKVGVSDQVATVLKKIQSDSTDRYTCAKKLESFLKGFEYTTNPGDMPESVKDGKSFLDYFVLKSRKGYCTYYATAFVLMARELGMPARYVQGYYTDRNISKDVDITQSQAHAWPEVYFDHVGWISFEPTPGYFMENGWEVQRKAGEEMRGEGSASVKLDKGKVKKKSSFGKVLVANLDVMIFAVLSALLFFAFCLCINRVLSRWKYKHLCREAKLRHLLEENLKLLGKYGCPIQMGETLSEYQSRLSREIAELDVHFLTYYEEWLYADIPVDMSWILPAEETHKMLKQRIRKKRFEKIFRVKKNIKGQA